MPIVSISKIQNRYGLSDNGPSNPSTLQLSTAELGWEIDSRRLFIGNGPVSEGAPQIGNTEILTQHSDILGVSSGYQYKGEAAGYIAETGTSASDPTVRTLQRKLDDFASVKDFGASPDYDAATNTAAINRAFYELFAREANEEVRRSLFFPAGIYLVDETIKIPAYAKVYGEGKNSSIIRQTTVTPGFAFADSNQQLSPGMSPTYPSFIEINDISFESTQQGTVLEIANSQNCVLRRVGLVGSNDTPTEIGDGDSTVFIHSEQVTTRNIVFEQCDISNNVFGILADDDMQSILFNGCHFHSLFKGAQLGENSTGTGPKGLKITNSYFNDIFNAGIHAYDDISGIVSAYNYFADVGNSSSSIPTSDIVIFQGNGNASISDIFDRSDSDNESFLRINISGKSSYALNTPDGMYYGYHKTEAGKLATLTAGLTDTSTGLSFSSTDQTSTLIYYTATKGTDQRQGTLRITGSVLTDEYSETTDLGLTFDVVDSAGTIALNYTLDAGTDVTFKYRIERLT